MPPKCRIHRLKGKIELKECMTDRIRLRAVAQSNGWTPIEPLDPPLFFEWDCFTSTFAV